jgi:ankyrin repeat protein
MSKQEELIAAVKSGNESRVRELLDEDRSLLSAREGNVSAILLAVYHGKPAVAKVFVERGARLSFFEAAALGDFEQVKSLVAADPSLIHKYSDDGYAPFGFATFFGHPEIDLFLLDRGADIHAQATNAQRVGSLHAAAAACNRDMMARLLERGADPNMRQQLDYTPLHTAAARGDREMASLLLGHGAKRDAKGTDGKTPADVAREHGQADFAEWLSSFRAP